MIVVALSACSANTEPPPPATKPGVTIAKCRDDEMPRVDGTCLAVGARDTPAPPPVCPAGKMAIPGDAACREIAACPSGKWPAVDGARVFVDAAASAGDGTEAAPFPTIKEALAAAPGATIVVTDGKYEADLSITRATKIVGRCPSAVELVGLGTFTIDAKSDLELSNIAVSGVGVGVGVIRARVVLDRVWIHDTGDRALDVEDLEGSAELIVRDSLIERATEIGAFAEGSKLTLERTVVRGTKKPTSGTHAQGVLARAGAKSGAPGTLTMRRSLVEDNIVFGVNVIDSAGALEDTVVRKTAATSASPAAGLTVQKVSGKTAPTIALRRVLFEGHAGIGVDISEATGTLEDVAVLASGGAQGTGYFFVKSTLDATRLTAEQLVGNGLSIRSSTVTLTSGRFRDIRQGEAGTNGAGIVVESDAGPNSDVKLGDILVERTHAAGILVFGSTAEMHDVTVRATKPTFDGTLGDGIAVLSVAYLEGATDPAHVTLTRALLEGNARAGLVVFGAAATLGDSILCNPIDLDVERTIGVVDGAPLERDFSLTDLGNNRCGCATTVSCTARSTGLTPVAR